MKIEIPADHDPSPRILKHLADLAIRQRERQKRAKVEDEARRVRRDKTSRAKRSKSRMQKRSRARNR